ncbi:molybdopterin-dependent oxidoreductase [Austwickia chelonae]|uniref:molybdopterin-dependent oxidoreductase n=1 Tax=Austwickia chelonae TaxID=100225 RepID=UPI000E28457C|nr:molybdopterin-dependent oxidoreductase [Austwickia chelonae]
MSTTAESSPPWVDGLAGLVAAGVGVAAGQFVASVTDPTSGPVTAVGAVAVDLVPAWLKDWAIDTFGLWDKAVLVGVVLVGVGVLAWGCGLLGRSSPLRGLVALVGVGALGAAADLYRTDGASFLLIPSLAAVVLTVVAYAVAVFLLHPSPEPRSASVRVSSEMAARPGDRQPSTPSGIDRRTFTVGGLAVLAASGVVVVVAGVPGPQTPVTLPRPAEPLAKLPAGLDTPGVAPLQTPQSDFFRIDIALAAPRVDPGDWRLAIDGMVDAPFSLTWEQLTALPMVERDMTLACVSNVVGGSLIGSGRWLGVEVAPLLRRARPRGGADQVLSRAADGFTASTPLEVLLDGRDALIAIALDGEPLTRQHGAPARLLVPGLYGYVGATKWLQSLSVSTFAEEQAYWTKRGWSERGEVKTSSRIDTPRARSAVPAGRVVLAGVAWANHRGVAGVQAQVDGGPWQEAELGDEVGVDYWRQWRLPVELGRGVHRVQVRAVDATGAVQIADPAPVVPDGATGLHVVEFLCE